MGKAVKQGARLLVGGEQYQHPERPHGHYFEATLLADVTMDMEIAKQECFAPILLVLKAEVSQASASTVSHGTSPLIRGCPVYGSLHRDS